MVVVTREGPQDLIPCVLLVPDCRCHNGPCVPDYMSFMYVLLDHQSHGRW